MGTAIAATTTGVVAPVATVGILSGLGFTTAGVVAGTTAAAAQAGIGSVAAGSLFATAQSVAALGLGSAMLSIGLPAAAIGGLGYLTYRLW